MSSLQDQVLQLLTDSGHAEPAPELAMQLKALLEHLRMQQLCEHLGTQRQADVAKEKEDPVAAILTQLVGALNQRAIQHTAHTQLSVQERQAAAVAVANNQQRVEALLEHQLELQQKSKAQQPLQDLSTSCMPGVQSHSTHRQQQTYTVQQQCQQYHSQQYQQYEPQQQQYLKQQHIPASLFNSAPPAVPTPPVQQQQEQRQQEDGQSQQPPKRRRGRPASSSSKVHPNLVYVRRFRERQKQMELGLEATVKAKQLELQRLQVEQQQLCVKWEALEQVLQVQNHVVSVMQQLRVSDPVAAATAATAAALYADQPRSCKLEKQQQQQQQQQQQLDVNARTGPVASDRCNIGTAPKGAAEQPVSPGESNPRPAAAGAGNASARGIIDRQGANSAVEAAVAEVVAVLKESVPPVDPMQEQAYLLQQARRFLEPVKIYSMRAALMLEQLGMLPAIPAAEAALAAAKACPAAGASATLPSLQATAGAIAAAIAAAAKEREPAAASKTAAAVAVAVRSAWDGAAAADALFASNGPVKQPGDKIMDGVPLVQYPYGIGMYVITPDAIKNVCWPLNMETWCVDSGNNQLHAAQAGRAMWAVLRPERWKLLHATWLTMSQQLQQVQQDFVYLHHLLRTLGEKPKPVGSNSRSRGTGVRRQQDDMNADASKMHEGSNSNGASDSGAAAALSTQQQQQQQQPTMHGLCYDGFESMEDSTAYEYAAAAVQVENVLLRENAISFQLCGAFLELLDPLELAVGFVSSWPYHPQVFTMFDVVFKLGEPPEEPPTGVQDTSAGAS